MTALRKPLTVYTPGKTHRWKRGEWDEVIRLDGGALKVVLYDEATTVFAAGSWTRYEVGPLG